MCPYMHPGGVEPNKERLLIIDRLVDELVSGCIQLVIDSLHPFYGERTGVFDLLFADFAPRVLGCVVRISGPAMENATWPVLLFKVGVLRIVVGVRLLFRV